MPQTISSSLTFVLKWVFPVVWSVGWGLGTAMVLLVPSVMPVDGDAGGGPAGIGVLLVGGWLLGTAYLVASGRVLKRVRVSASELLVSNYLREIRVPLREVVAIRRRIFPHAGGVAIEFRTRTAFRSTVSFIANRSWWTGGVDALVDELRTLVARAPAG